VVPAIIHETALATLQSSEDCIVLGDLVKNEPTILVFDNQDYNEETKSGKGQTHIAAGIVIQQSGTQANTGKTKALVSKRKRRLDAQNKELPYFQLGGNKSLKLSHLSEFVSTDAEEHYYPQDIPQKLNFLFTLCKFQSQDLPFNLPGWTGFNTLLANDVGQRCKCKKEDLSCPEICGCTECDNQQSAETADCDDVYNDVELDD
jgi:hypothetical protein